jgi:glycosyltransferase involved in cell wall biosynthesis
LAAIEIALLSNKSREIFKSLVRNSKVIYTGSIVHYTSADIFLHCSITETFGLVVLEAMASSVPVIARDEGGPSDTVDHGRTGYLVPPNDLEGFVRRVLQLGRDTDLMQ